MTGVYDTRRCVLGEGALWHPERRELFWFDIIGRRLLSRGDAGAREWVLPEMFSAAGWVDARTLFMASETGVWRFDIETGALDRLGALEADRPGTRSNDGRADPQGGFWIGTMGKRAEPGQGAIWRWHRGETRRLFTGITIPNAICFSPDGTRAHFADTTRQRIEAVPLDAEGWPAGEARTVIDLRPEGLYPDGAVTDAEGNLWVAEWGAGRVAAHAPDGRFLRAVPVGAPHASCPAFGGVGLDRLFVTTAQEGLDAAALAAAPLSGCVFAADPAAKGRAEPAVRL